MLLRTVKRPDDDPKVRRSISRILRESPLCSMATVGPGGRAHINTAYFCYSDRMDVYFLSDPGSIHCRNLANRPTMAITISRSSQAWGRSDRGLQLFGTCREASGRTATTAERLYAGRFPQYARWMHGTSAAARRQAAQLRAYRFYRFRTRRVKILDEAEFGGAVFVVVDVRRTAP